jgi:hypothetical protein
VTSELGSFIDFISGNQKSLNFSAETIPGSQVKSLGLYPGSDVSEEQTKGELNWVPTT